uniref:Uncharacterized protein n=1 Tax=Anopheles funestus TaxID=62324 RepID=A0A182RVY4_ANOFN
MLRGSVALFVLIAIVSGAAATFGYGLLGGTGMGIMADLVEAGVDTMDMETMVAMGEVINRMATDMDILANMVAMVVMEDMVDMVDMEDMVDMVDTVVAVMEDTEDTEGTEVAMEDMED